MVFEVLSSPESVPRARFTYTLLSYQRGSEAWEGMEMHFSCLACKGTFISKSSSFFFFTTCLEKMKAQPKPNRNFLSMPWKCCSLLSPSWCGNRDLHGLLKGMSPKAAGNGTEQWEQGRRRLRNSSGYLHFCIIVFALLGLELTIGKSTFHTSTSVSAAGWRNTFTGFFETKLGELLQNGWGMSREMGCEGAQVALEIMTVQTERRELHQGVLQDL